MRSLKVVLSIIGFCLSGVTMAASTDFSTLELIFRDDIEESTADEGFGSITPPCPRIIEFDGFQHHPAEAGGRIDFGPGYSETDKPTLTPGAREIIDTGSAGGSALLSVAFAYEWLARCNGHLLLRTKEEIRYDVAGKVIDFTAGLGFTKFGVTVARGVNYPLDTPIDLTTASRLLEGKLDTLSAAVENVSAIDQWDRGVLVVLTPLDESASNLVAALAGIHPTTRADHIVIVIVTDGLDDSLY